MFIRMKGEKIMNQISMEERLKRAAGVICKQGMVQFQVSQTAIDIIEATVGKNTEELDLIYAFRQQPSQTMDQLLASSGFSEEKIQQLAASLAKKGLLFNQPNSAGVMVYRILPLMLVGLMEYKFMVELTGSQEEKRLAVLFENLLAELRNQVQDNYDALLPLFNSAPAADRTVPSRVSEDGRSIKIIKKEG